MTLKHWVEMKNSSEQRWWLSVRQVKDLSVHCFVAAARSICWLVRIAPWPAPPSFRFSGALNDPFPVPIGQTIYVREIKVLGQANILVPSDSIFLIQHSWRCNRNYGTFALLSLDPDGRYNPKKIAHIWQVYHLPPSIVDQKCKYLFAVTIRLSSFTSVHS